METRTATHRYNGAGFVEVGVHKDLHSASYTIDQHGIECNRLQLQFETQDQVAGSTSNTAEDCTVVLPSGTKLKQEENTAGAPVKGNDRPQSSSLEKDCSGNIEP